MSTNDIRITDLLVQRDGRVWIIPARQGDRKETNIPTKMGAVYKAGPGWRFRCDDCSHFVGTVRRTRREAVLDLVDHWNEERP